MILLLNTIVGTGGAAPEAGRDRDRNRGEAFRPDRPLRRGERGIERRQRARRRRGLPEGLPAE